MADDPQTPSERAYYLQQRAFYQRGSGRGVRQGFWENRPEDFTGPEHGLTPGAASWTMVNPARAVRGPAMSDSMRLHGKNAAERADARLHGRRERKDLLRQRDRKPGQKPMPREQLPMGSGGARAAYELGPGPRPIGAIENTGFAGELGPGEPMIPMGARGPAEFAGATNGPYRPSSVAEKTWATPAAGAPTTKPMYPDAIETTATDAAPETTSMKPIARNKATRQGTGIQSKGRGRVSEMLAGAAKTMQEPDAAVGNTPKKPKRSAMGVPQQSIGNPWGEADPPRRIGTPVQSIGNPWAYDPT